MIRNSILYHRLWYVRRRNSWKIRIFVGLISLFLLLGLIITYVQKSLVPYLVEGSEYKTRALITSIVNNVIIEEEARGLSYKDIIILNRDALNNITSVETDLTKTSKLSGEICSRIENFLIAAENGKTSISSLGNVETDFKTEFSSEGLNQTRYRLYLQVKVEAGINIPFMRRTAEIITNIPFADTIIIGKAPGFYTEN